MAKFIQIVNELFYFWLEFVLDKTILVLKIIGLYNWTLKSTPRAWPWLPWPCSRCIWKCCAVRIYIRKQPTRFSCAGKTLLLTILLKKMCKKNPEKSHQRCTNKQKACKNGKTTWFFEFFCANWAKFCADTRPHFRAF